MTSRAKRSGRIAASDAVAPGGLDRDRHGADVRTAGASPRWDSISRSTRSCASATSAGGPTIRAPKLSAQEISSRAFAYSLRKIESSSVP